MNKIFIPEKIFENEFLTKYYILDRKQLLGSGGFGNVYRAKIIKTSETCAIKIQYFQNDFDIDEKSREIAVIKELGDQPHIIQNLGYFPEPEKQENYNFNIIVMELAEESLVSFLYPNKGKSPIKMKKMLLIQMIFDIISGLKYAHSNNISHSDIKPGNILVFKKPRALCKKAQKKCVFDENMIFKLCDWGISRFTKSIDITAAIESYEQTTAFASPEMCSKKDKINLQKADIYSLGLVILNCCGVDNKEFISLNFKMDKKDHSLDLRRILKKFMVEKNYGENMENLIKNLVSFDHHERFDFDQILQSLKDIVEETKKDLCQLCGKKKHKNNIDLACKHRFGSECFYEFLADKFNENPVYLPKCPIDSCLEIISRKEIGEMMENDVECKFNHFFSKCRNPKCEKKLFTYKCFLPKLSCGHRFCEECILEAFGNTMKCPIKKCSEPFNEKTQQKIDELSEKCRICDTEIEELFHFTCCNMEICENCFLKEFVNEYQVNEKKSKNITFVFCKKCDKDLSSLAITSIISKRSFKLYNQKICMECNKYKKKLEKLSTCKHKICEECLKQRISDPKKVKRQCPVEDCLEKIPKELLSKYQATKEESVTTGNKKNQRQQYNIISQETSEENMSQNPSASKQKTLEKDRSSSNMDLYTYFMKKDMQTSKTEQKLPNFVCSACLKFYNKSDILEILECKHRFCRSCLDKNLKILLKKTPIPKTPLLLKCLNEKCMHSMKLLDLKNTLPETLYLNLEAVINMTIPEVEEQPVVKEKMAFCQICKQEAPEKDCVTSACCKQIFCLSCLRNNLSEKINSKQLDLHCPCCNTLFAYQFIKKNAGIDLFKKYEEDLLQSVIEKIKQEEENLADTPGEN